MGPVGDFLDTYYIQSRSKQNLYTKQNIQNFPGVSDVFTSVVPLSIKPGGQWIVVYWLEL